MAAITVCHRIVIMMMMMMDVPVAPTAHTATGVMQESQSRGVNKLLLHTAPSLFTQTSQDAESEPGYEETEHSNSVMWCTSGFFEVLQMGEGKVNRRAFYAINAE